MRMWLGRGQRFHNDTNHFEVLSVNANGLNQADTATVDTYSLAEHLYQLYFHKDITFDSNAACEHLSVDIFLQPCLLQNGRTLTPATGSHSDSCLLVGWKTKAPEANGKFVVSIKY